ncbi:hypothetical protein AB3S75_000204 [Citrus x aurantiifolia]
MENCFAVSSKGKSGGLAMLWNSETNVNISSFSSHYIDAEIVTENGDQMRCTGIYGHPEANQKKQTWTLLRRLVGLSSSSWLCFGDFNEIMHLNEKNGGNDREPSMIIDFREAVEDCHLRDVGYNGYPFTWSNRRSGIHFIEERLDRFLCSKEWSNLFQDQAATNLVTWCSDHNPVLMAVKRKDEEGHYKRKCFSRAHYEDFWSSYDECREIIEENWAKHGKWEGADVVKLVSKDSLAGLIH